MFVRVVLLNLLLQRVARENEGRVAAELLPIIDRWPEIGLRKRPTPIEGNAIVWAGAAQDKTIIHADRGKSARASTDFAARGEDRASPLLPDRRRN